MVRIAVLDDYQGTAAELADWDSIPGAEVTFFPTHVGDPDALAEMLAPLKHAGRIYIAAPDDPKIPEHIGFTPTSTIEDAITEARKHHGPNPTIACIRNPMGA